MNPSWTLGIRDLMDSTSNDTNILSFSNSSAVTPDELSKIIAKSIPLLAAAHVGMGGISGGLGVATSAEDK